ncbi:hypothetical protein MKEN_00966900 [Mycena kentingensis (nom. inval.)]|nr:hypothetical protein MKEN_00966900 [Mycena kentingensis (nom. inval.)]
MTPERAPLLRASSCRVLLAEAGSPTDNHSHEPHSGLESTDTGHHHQTPQEHFFRISLTLQNAGSVARDHLASERTFLAYVRTSLAMSAAGVALVQLFIVSDSGAGRTDSEGNPSPSKHHARSLAGGCILLGLYLLLVGVSYLSWQCDSKAQPGNHRSMSTQRKREPELRRFALANATRARSAPTSPAKPVSAPRAVPIPPKSEQKLAGARNHPLPPLPTMQSPAPAVQESSPSRPRPRRIHANAIVPGQPLPPFPVLVVPGSTVPVYAPPRSQPEIYPNPYTTPATDAHGRRGAISGPAGGSLWRNH